MNHSSIMALLIAGGLVCGGFAAFAADNAKPAEVKPAEAKPAEAKPVEVKPAEAKPAEVKPTEAKPVEAKPEGKPTETKTGAEVKSAETKPTEAKPAEDPFSAIPPVLAEIGDLKITKDMAVEELNKLIHAGLLPAEMSADVLKNVLPHLAQKVVMEKILELEFEKAGIKPNEEMARAKLKGQIEKMVKNQAFQLALDNYLEVKGLKNVKVDKTVTPDEVRKFYEANKDRWFKKAEPDQPDQLRASHILIASDGKDAEADRKAKEKAEQLIKILKEKPDEFEVLAKDNSSDGNSRESGGDLGVYAPGSKPAEFEKALLALKEGEITSAPVKTKDGYHIIRRNPLKTQAEWTPFEEVKAEIERHLKRQKDEEEQQAQENALMEHFSRLEKEYKVNYLIEIPTEPAL